MIIIEAAMIISRVTKCQDGLTSSCGLSTKIQSAEVSDFMTV